MSPRQTYIQSSSLVRQIRSQTPQSALRDIMTTTVAIEDQPQTDESVGSSPQTSGAQETWLSPSLSPVPQGMPVQVGPISPLGSPGVVSPQSYNDDATPLLNVGTTERETQTVQIARIADAVTALLDSVEKVNGKLSTIDARMCAVEQQLHDVDAAMFPRSPISEFPPGFPRNPAN